MVRDRPAGDLQLQLQHDVRYTDDEGYVPNEDAFLHEQGFERTPIRPRKP